jgi:hypothetical protein
MKDFIKKVSLADWIKIILLIIVIIIGCVIIFSQNSNSSLQKTNTGIQATTTATTSAPVKTTASSAKKITTTTSSSSVAKNVTSKCNFKVTSPTMYSSISMPFTINGIIDKTDTHESCIWNEAYSRAGEAEIFYDRNGEGWKSAGTQVPIITSSIPGKASTTLAFSASINLYTAAFGLNKGTPIKIVFTELNISDAPNPDTFDFIAYLK